MNSMWWWLYATDSQVADALRSAPRGVTGEAVESAGHDRCDGYTCHGETVHHVAGESRH